MNHKIKKAASFHQTTSPKNIENYSSKPHFGKCFNRSKLPNIIDFYMRELKKLSFREKWATGLCCFHDDHNPSLSVNTKTGAFRCFSANCNARGKDIIDFFMQKYGCDFKTAAQALGAWED